ncbi:MAG: GatB/YqeY domain-containing protein [Candidatus Colwellbacteria bacterium]|nr:GatB/YqeY domain-containing protein [Candidatus Colwellbacteria bacterium]
MASIDELKADSKAALKQGEALKLETIRFLLASLHNAEIEKRARSTSREEAELTEVEAIAVLNKEAKKRKEAMEIYAGAGRKDLEEKEAKELEIIKSYLPAELTPAEIEAIINKVISAGSGSFGEVMKEVMGQVSGRADSKTVSELVKQKLGQG